MYCLCNSCMVVFGRLSIGEPKEKHERSSMSKRNKGKTGPYGSRAERNYATTCLHEATHAVTAVLVGIQCEAVHVWDDRNGRPNLSKPEYANFLAAMGMGTEEM